MPHQEQGSFHPRALSEKQMVTDMQLSAILRKELAQALDTFKYELSPQGVYLPGANVTVGGVFGIKVDDGPMHWGDNAAANEGINLMLAAAFVQGAQPTAWYLAPFTNNVTPTSTLTAATFASVQGEYTGYSESARQVWTPDASPTAQVVQNVVAPAVFTVAGSPATLLGAGLLTASAKGATTGSLGAAGLFGVSNTLNVGSKITVEYVLTVSAA